MNCEDHDWIKVVTYKLKYRQCVNCSKREYV